MSRYSLLSDNGRLYWPGMSEYKHDWVLHWESEAGVMLVATTPPNSPRPGFEVRFSSVVNTLRGGDGFDCLDPRVIYATLSWNGKFVVTDEFSMDDRPLEDVVNHILYNEFSRFIDLMYDFHLHMKERRL